MASADDKTDCVAAHEEGQIARREGRFDRAREAFASCQVDACPAVIRTRCAEFARDLEAAQPTIVILVRDAHGGDVDDARVGIDSGPLGPVSAMALRLNPGKHRLHVEASGFFPADKTVMLPEGVKGMQAIATLDSVSAAASATAAAPTRPPPAGQSRTAAWAFAIGSGLSLAAAAALSGTGWMVHSDLKGSCGVAGCTEAQVEPLRVLWPASFVALGVGVISGVVATILFASRSSPDPTSALLVGPGAGVIRFP
jgi:hypothetical protein